MLHLSYAAIYDRLLSLQLVEWTPPNIEKLDVLETEAIFPDGGDNVMELLLVYSILYWLQITVYVNEDTLVYFSYHEAKITIKNFLYNNKI